MKLKKLSFISLLKGMSIEQGNAQFELLSNIEKKKEIAYDALKMISLGKMGGSYKSYWDDELEIIMDNSESSKQFQEKLLKVESCTVCARGAVMLSTIRLGNSISPEEHYSAAICQGWNETVKGFSMKEMGNMEIMYEGYEYIDEENSICQKYDFNSTEMLTNILLQVIETGSFSLEDETDYLAKYL